MHFSPADIAVLLLALLGHAGLTVGFANRVNAIGWPRVLVKCLDRLIYLSMGLLLARIVWTYISPDNSLNSRSLLGSYGRGIYVLTAACVGIFLITAWFNRRVLKVGILPVRDEQSQHIDVAKELGYRPLHGAPAKLAAMLPINQLLKLDVHHRTLGLSRLPEALDGLTITHLSDFHFTGRVGKPYFEAVVQRANELDGDIVAITGDIFDSADCFRWIPDTLARLRSRHGVFFILGNHDVRTKNLAGARRVLTTAGMIDLGSKVHEISVRGEPIVLAGNELPWIGQREELPSVFQRTTGAQPLKILLSHSPDQIRWAQQQRFDLVLAGHTHGGQIRPPIIGPIVCPSRYGVRYASGVYDCRPCVMHVVRGISSKTPLRINCSPEIVKLTLRHARSR